MKGGSWGGGVTIECWPSGQFLCSLSITSYLVARKFELSYWGMCEMEGVEAGYCIMFV